MTHSKRSPALRGLLRQAELDAEKLVALLRMGVAAVLAVQLFSLAEPVESAELSEVLIRQWVFVVSTVLAYFLLGAVTWLLAVKGWLRNWMIWPAAAADVAFVLLNIWMSLHNTGLPGEALFLLVSVWLVPIVMIFGMLRGNLRVMLFVLVSLMAGLGGFLAFVPNDPGSPLSIENTIELQPNLIRLTMVAILGVLVSVGVYRARALLQKSIDASQNAANLTRYLPEQLAPRLAEGVLDELRKGRRHMAGVLFIDIRGFTQWSQTQTSVAVTSLVTEFRERISRVAQDTGGIIDKFMGDAAMIVFDEADDGAAAACVRCAERLADEMQALSLDRAEQGQDPVRVGIGAHWGEVFSGVVGDQGRLEFSVFGDTVNIAARLEEATRGLELEIVLSQALVSAAEVDGNWSVLEPLPVRGRDGQVPVVGRRFA